MILLAYVIGQWAGVLGLGPAQAGGGLEGGAVSIKTQDRPVIRKQAVILRGPSGYRFECDRCAFHREWATETGAVNGVAQHLRAAHGATLTLRAS